MTQQTAWDLRDDDDAPKADTNWHARIAEILLGALLPFESLQLAGYPVTELAVVGFVLLAMVRRPTVAAPIPRGLTLAASAFIGVVLLSSYLGAGLDVRRVGHIGLYLVFAAVLATGRLSWRSVGIGVGAGLLAAGGAWFWGVNDGYYVGRLSGFFGDPNLAGFDLVVYGAIALAAWRNAWTRIVLAGALVVLLYLTASRTSLLAAGFLVVWVLLGRWVTPAVGALVLGVLVWVAQQIPQELQQGGQFVDRAGSDALRGRIVAAERIKIDASPWFGHGSGTANVVVDQNTFFFHNSYFAMVGEFGAIAMVVFGAAMIGLFGWAVTVGRPARSAWLEAALIGSMVCGIHLGEVLLAMPTAVAVGGLMNHRLRHPGARHRARDSDNAWQL